MPLPLWRVLSLRLAGTSLASPWLVAAERPVIAFRVADASAAATVVLDGHRAIHDRAGGDRPAEQRVRVVDDQVAGCLARWRDRRSLAVGATHDPAAVPHPLAVHDDGRIGLVAVCRVLVEPDRGEPGRHRVDVPKTHGLPVLDVGDVHDLTLVGPRRPRLERMGAPGASTQSGRTRPGRPTPWSGGTGPRT